MRNRRPIHLSARYSNVIADARAEIDAAVAMLKLRSLASLERDQVVELLDSASARIAGLPNDPEEWRA